MPIHLQVLKDPSATMPVLVASLQDHLSCCIDSTNLTPQEANENLLNFISDITDTLELTPGQNITTALVGRIFSPSDLREGGSILCCILQLIDAQLC